MMKGGSQAPTPDPNIGKAAIMQAETGERWLGFAREAFAISNERQAELDQLTKQVTALQMGIMGDQAEWSRSDRQRYESQFRPLEDEFVREAREYGSPERQAQAAAEAKADVQMAGAGARDAARRDAASMGLNPASGRFAGMDRAAEMGTALASAGAQNTARQQVRDKGLALKADAVNLGRGLPAMSAQGAGISLGAGSGAVGLNQGNQALFQQSAGIMGQGFGGQMAGYAGMGQTLNQQYSTQVAAWDAQQRHAAAGMAGIGSFLGGITGLFKSDKDKKKDKKAIPEGEALEAVNEMPVEEWTYKEGVADEGRHVGTYAQEFQRATGQGDGENIPIIDAIGVSMKAIQDLDDKVDRIAEAVGIGDVVEMKKPALHKRRHDQEYGLGIAA